MLEGNAAHRRCSRGERMHVPRSYIQQERKVPYPTSSRASGITQVLRSKMGGVSAVGIAYFCDSRCAAITLLDLQCFPTIEWFAPDGIFHYHPIPALAVIRHIALVDSDSGQEWAEALETAFLMTGCIERLTLSSGWPTCTIIQQPRNLHCGQPFMRNGSSLDDQILASANCRR